MEQGTSLREVWTAKLVLAVLLVICGTVCFVTGQDAAGLSLVSVATGLIAGGGVTTAIVKSDQRNGNTPETPGQIVS